jgi:hypothetical protein
MTSKNIKDWGVSARTTQPCNHRTTPQWIQASNPHSRIQALSAFKTWYFQQHKNSL